MNRRRFLLSGSLAALALGSVGALWRDEAEAETFSVTFTEREWRARLSQDAFAVLRQEATERPFTSPLLNVHETGLFHCAGCDNAVYSTEAKYDSGTGWPSFWDAIDGSIGTKTDYVLVYPRTEVHCAQCGGHFGHIFDDGPPPTGKRHCLNGVALRFQPSDTQS
ncbi:peptide-methionine (R)-S-oxide reductase MsrB [Aureimonas sp. AU40]|uniref:peptide-methionine (R)-S-oxide reductase MsrB n=1 Tax=Aureimonas sp. AU40 TaxID=1637747 RepID=UPI000780E5A7|nr:peptide-methionine (R)-S-oxide reductase MsrB [Aureimonas sp. AU40]